MNKLFLENFYGNCNIVIQENAFENVVCEMATMLSRPQCVNWRQVIICPANGSVPDMQQAISLMTQFIAAWNCKTCNISNTLVGNKFVYHSEVVGDGPTTSSFLTINTWLQWIGQIQNTTQLQDEMRNI